MERGWGVGGGHQRPRRSGTKGEAKGWDRRRRKDNGDNDCDGKTDDDNGGDDSNGHYKDSKIIIIRI